MFAENIKSKLLVDLPEEQQQLVSGGGGYGDVIKDKLSTHFKTDATITEVDVAQVSTPEGSKNLQKFKHDTINVDTAAYKNLFAYLQ